MDRPVIERPILFSGPMVRAILEGRKTQTRRVVRWQGPKGFPHDFSKAFTDNPAGIKRLMVPYHHPDDSYADGCAYRHYPPHGDPGDRLWVRETWQEFFNDEIPEGRTRSVRGRMGIPAEPERLSYVAFRADGEMPDHPIAGKAIWRPSIYMPRWASRITLEITGVRVERLHDISEDDAKAEGCHGTGASSEGWLHDSLPLYTAVFRELWDSINAKRAPWGSNPWVWVISFKRLP